MQKEEKMSLLKSNEGMSIFSDSLDRTTGKEKENRTVEFAGISCLQRLMILNLGLTFNPGFRVFGIINKMN